MIVHLGEREEVVRTLLDTGSTVPLLSRTFTQTKMIPVAERLSIRPIQDYAGQEVDVTAGLGGNSNTLKCRLNLNETEHEG